jgi:DNA-binding transcriptional LysR family regulator
MELRHLRYFIAIAEEGHISRAAERLGIQQPPLSQQLKAMERELDVQLFRRKARGVEMTDAGRALLDDARVMLSHLDRAVETTRRAARGELGRLCLGVTSTTPFHPLVPRAIRAFREACPMVALTVEECLSNESIERLQNESMDAAFIRTSLPGSSKLAVAALLEEPMVVALPAAHPLAQEKREAVIAMKRLADEVFILYGPPGTGMYDAIIAACQSAGFNPRLGNLGASTQQAPRIGSTLSLVAAGLGVTCVPSSLQRMNLEGVVYRRIRPAEQPKTVLNLATRRGDPSAVVMQFANIVRKTAKTVRPT